VPAGAAAVAAREQAEASFTQMAGGVPGYQLLLNLDQQQNAGSREPSFEKDLCRGMELTVDGGRVPDRVEDLPAPPAGQPAVGNPARALAQNAYERLAQFLFGAEAHFADLPAEQQRQVFLLAGLCNQEMENPAQICGQHGLLGADTGVSLGVAMVGGGDSTPRMRLERNGDGNFELHYKRSHPCEVVLETQQGGRMTRLDPAHSHQDVEVTLVFTPAELERLAGLDWTNIPRQNGGGGIPETHRMRFVDSRLESTLALQAR
jgi:hypothetical protein